MSRALTRTPISPRDAVPCSRALRSLGVRAPRHRATVNARRQAPKPPAGCFAHEGWYWCRGREDLCSRGTRTFQPSCAAVAAVVAISSSATHRLLHPPARLVAPPRSSNPPDTPCSPRQQARSGFCWDRELTGGQRMWRLTRPTCQTRNSITHLTAPRYDRSGQMSS
jgi:hypothetical protein